MTEAEKRVIEAAADVLRYFSPTSPDYCVGVRNLRDAVDALRIERAAPCSPPPAPAVDVAGLVAAEKALKVASDACVKAYERWRDAKPEDRPREKVRLNEEEATYYAAHHALDEALAAARKPKPALLTAEEACEIYVGDDGIPFGGQAFEEPMQAVLSAATERFVAAVEAGRRFHTTIAGAPGEMVERQDGLYVLVSDIRALAVQP